VEPATKAAPDAVVDSLAMLCAPQTMIAGPAEILNAQACSARSGAVIKK
jgi:hypothetical protein